MSGLIAGAKTIGMYSQQAPSPALPPFAADPDQVLQNILQKLDGLQTLVGTKADAGQLKTLIGFSEELVLIQAKEIAVNGAVTFLDLWKDQSGVVTGLVDPSITRIRGGVIQTEQIISSNWGAAEGSSIDLDNGKIVMGGSSNPKLLFEDGDLTISGVLTAGSIIAGSVIVGDSNAETMSSIQDNAQAGFNIQQALEVSGTTVLKGVLVPTDTGALKVGTITWSATTGALTGGTGIALTEWGILGAAAGVAKFSLEASTGNATFAGTVTAGAIIAGSVTLNNGAGESLTSIQNNAQSGFNIQQALEVSGTTVLKGVLVPTDSGALKVGTITWNSSTGALTGGTGIAITEFGIIGAASGSPSFTINASTGAATFAGALSAATGTFAGSLSAASGTFAGTISTTGSVLASGSVTAGGGTAAIIGNASTVIGVFGATGSGLSGVFGLGNNAADGVYGNATGSGYGVRAEQNFSSGGALIVVGKAVFGSSQITKTRANGHLVKIYDTTTHALLNTYEYSFE